MGTGSERFPYHQFMIHLMKSIAEGPTIRDMPHGSTLMGMRYPLTYAIVQL